MHFDTCSVSRYDYHDKEVEKFLRCFNENLSTPQTVLNLFPLSRFLPGLRAVHKNIARNRQVILKIVTDHISAHKETFQENDIRDYIDAYLASQQQRQTTPDSTFTGKWTSGINQPSAIILLFKQISGSGYWRTSL